MKFIKLFVVLIFLGAMSSIWAQVTLTAATGGTGISIDKTTGGGSSTYTTLTGPTIAETAHHQIAAGLHTLTLPAGWQFDITQIVTITITGTGGITLTSTTITPGLTTLSFNVTAESNGATNTLEFSNIKVVPTGTVPSTGNILMTAGAITGLDGTSNFGTLSTVAGAFMKLQLLVPGEVADPGTVNGKTVAAPSAQTAGTPFTVTVNAVDQFWNVVNTIVDNVGITSSDVNATLPANALLIAGTKTYSVTLKTVGSKTITATDITDGGKTPNTSPSITVNAGAFVKLQLLVPGEVAAPGTATGKTGTPSDRLVGASFNVTVNAVDANWNLVNTIVDNVGITSSDVNATLPANALLIAGTKIFAVTLITEGNQTITATDITDGGKAPNTSPSILVLSRPILTAPVNGLTGVSVLPTFTWTDTFDETTFTVKISTAGSSQAAFNAGVIVTKITAQNAVSYATLATDTGLPLSNGTLYYWQVSIQGGTYSGAYSTIYHFTTTPDIVPTLYNPADASTNYGTSVLFSWVTGTSTTGLKFKVQWYQKDSGNPTETQWAGASSYTTASLTYTKTGLLAGKRYCWRVIVLRSSNDDVLDYSAVQSFTNSGGASVTVYPSWPTGGATVYTNAPTLYWYLDQYATGLKYQVKYGTSNTDVNPADGEMDAGTKLPIDANLIANGSSNLYLTLPTLTPGTQYFWQVRAYYAAGDGDGNPAVGTDGYSAWTTPESFVTNGSGTLQVPIPSYPTGGVTVYTTSPTVYWYFNTAVTGLTYQVDWVDSTAGGGHSQSGALTPTSYQITGLTPGHTIGWRVRSYNGTNYSNYSSTETFVVAGGTTASYAVASYPIGNPTVYTNRPTLYWYLEGSSLGITGYELRYKKSANSPGSWGSYDVGGPNESGGQYVAFGTAATYSKQILADLTYGGHYYWAVRATGASTYSEGEFTVVGGSNATTIELSTPSDGSTVYSTGTTLYWYVNGSSAGITNYTVQLSQSDVFASFIFNGTVTTTYKALTGLTNGATYYWKVKANYADGSSTAFPTRFSFTVNTGAASVVQPLVGGPNNVTVNTSSPMLSWVLPAPTAANSTYEVQLADNPNFESAKTFSSAKSNMVVSGLVGGKSYFWKVRSKEGTGNTSYYSGTGQFKVNNSITAVEEKDVIPTSFELSQNYPNPFNPTTKIRYALPQNAFVSIKVYDMLGREVRSLVNNEMAEGSHSVEWSGDDNSGNRVSSGAYIYRITATAQAGQAGDPSAGSGQGFISTKKMIMLK